MTRIMRVVLVLVCVVAMTVPIIAAEKKIKVGFSVSDYTNPYWNTQVKGAQDKAKEYGIELIVHDSQTDPTREINALENWITQGVDGIMIATLDAQASQPYIKRAQEKGIKVVATIHPMEGADAWLKLDEYKFGYMAGVEAGKWIQEKLGGKAKFAVLTHDVYPHVVPRADGIRDGILEMAPNAEMAARQVALNPADAMQVIETVMQAHPDLKVIQGINDSGALGAYEAVRSAGKDTPDFYVGGNDATREALEKIKEGGIYRCSVDINPYGSGQVEVEMMWNLLNDTEFERVQLVPMTAVTVENVDEFLNR